MAATKRKGLFLLWLTYCKTTHRTGFVHSSDFFLDKCTKYVHVPHVFYRVDTIPGGLAGTEATVARMAALLKESLATPMVRLRALSVLRAAGSPSVIKEPARAAQILYGWQKKHITVVPDPLGVETVQAPNVTLRLGAGDCDDHALLTAALFESVGIPTRWRVIGDIPDNLSHVYVEARIEGDWLAFDTSAQAAYIRPPVMGYEKLYGENGGETVVNPSSSGPDVVPVKVADVKRSAYVSAFRKLDDNWRAGLIDLSDLSEYLRVIDKGNSPSYGTIVEEPMRKAIEDYRQGIMAQGAVSRKASGQLSGLEGLDGFLSSVWESVKTGVNETVKWGKAIFGDPASTVSASTEPYVVRPTVEIQATVPSQATTAGIQAILTSPTFIGLALVGLVLVLRKK